MVQRPVLVFLAKIVPLTLVSLVMWQGLGFSRPYHILLAELLGEIYPHLDPSGVVADVEVRDNQFYFTVILGAERLGLFVNAADITSNMTVLLALYLASPVRRKVRQFITFLACSLVVLFVVHGVTLITVSQEALMGRPGAVATAPFSTAQARLLTHYNVFMEEMGMYACVLLLWLPYIAWCMVRAGDTRRQ